MDTRRLHSFVRVVDAGSITRAADLLHTAQPALSLVDTWRHLEGRLRVVIVAAGPLRAQQSLSHERHTAIIDVIDNGDPTAVVDAINQHMALSADHFSVRAR